MDSGLSRSKILKKYDRRICALSKRLKKIILKVKISSFIEAPKSSKRETLGVSLARNFSKSSILTKVWRISYNPL
jgi:hypothetical protein